MIYTRILGIVQLIIAFYSYEAGGGISLRYRSEDQKQYIIKYYKTTESKYKKKRPRNCHDIMILPFMT